MMNRLTLDDLPPDQFCTYVHHDMGHLVMGEPHDHDFHELFWIEDSEGFQWVNG